MYKPSIACPTCGTINRPETACKSCGMPAKGEPSNAIAKRSVFCSHDSSARPIRIYQSMEGVKATNEAPNTQPRNRKAMD